MNTIYVLQTDKTIINDLEIEHSFSIISMANDKESLFKEIVNTIILLNENWGDSWSPDNVTDESDVYCNNINLFVEERILENGLYKPNRFHLIWNYYETKRYSFATFGPDYELLISKKELSMLFTLLKGKKLEDYDYERKVDNNEI